MNITYPDPMLTQYASFLIESTLDRHHVPPDILLAALFKRVVAQTKHLSDDEFEEEISNLRRMRSIENGDFYFK